MAVAQLDRPDIDDTPVPGRCLVCDRVPSTGFDVYACRACRLDVDEALQDIPPLYALLETVAARTGQLGRTGSSNRGAPGFGSRSPARDDVLVLLDRRRQTFDPAHPRRACSVAAMLGYWLDEADILGWSSVAGCAAVLRASLDRLVGQWWFGTFAAAVLASADHLRRATAQHEETVVIGACPTPLPGVKQMVFDADADRWRTEAVLCGGQVRARTLGDAGRCGRCGKRWEGFEELRALARRLGDPMLDLPGLSRLLGVTSLATLRSWAHRDGWDRQRDGGRTIYSLADARESAFRAWDRKHPVHGCEEGIWTLLPVQVRVSRPVVPQTTPA